ncbi:helix-turn-helix domain-containing protein [Tritonibacter mobilis]|uniref:helix-turn-helix domain-containing protein n=1 Tax=Tritonibacter mobilis TaxID=379347 RepID=UPI000E0D03F2|nr:helix-turn-helix domain-containing protein [Tritonibacter mobilis]
MSEESQNKSGSAFERDLFSAQLGELVEKRGAIAHICKNAGLNRQQFNRYLSGENVPSLATAYRIASALGVSLDSLAGQAVTREPNPEKMPLDQLFNENASPNTGLVEPGFYWEITRYGDPSDQFVLSLTHFIPQKTGGLYYRYNQAARADGTIVPQEFWGRYYEAEGKVTVFQTNTRVRNTMGSMALRRLDGYGAELAGQKMGHRFISGARVTTSITALKFIGREVEQEPNQLLTGIKLRSEIPADIMVLYDSVLALSEAEPGRLHF